MKNLIIDIISKYIYNLDSLDYYRGDDNMKIAKDVKYTIILTEPEHTLLLKLLTNYTSSNELSFDKAARIELIRGLSALN